MCSVYLTGRGVCSQYPVISMLMIFYYLGFGTLVTPTPQDTHTPPFETRLPLDCHCNSGVNSQYQRDCKHPFL